MAVRVPLTSPALRPAPARGPTRLTRRSGTGVLAASISRPAAAFRASPMCRSGRRSSEADRPAPADTLAEVSALHAPPDRSSGHTIVPRAGRYPPCRITRATRRHPNHGERLIVTPAMRRMNAMTSPDERHDEESFVRHCYLTAPVSPRRAAQTGASRQTSTTTSTVCHQVPFLTSSRGPGHSDDRSEDPSCKSAMRRPSGRQGKIVVAVA